MPLKIFFILIPNHYSLSSSQPFHSLFSTSPILSFSVFIFSIWLNTKSGMKTHCQEASWSWAVAILGLWKWEGQIGTNMEGPYYHTTHTLHSPKQTKTHTLHTHTHYHTLQPRVWERAANLPRNKTVFKP